MVMKAVECTVDSRRVERDIRPADKPPVKAPRPVVSSGESNMDELIMMLIPKVTFDAMEDLAKKHGGSVAQVMSVALKLLQLKSEEDENGS